MRILFLGNHTLGVKTLATLSGRATVAGVVAHPPDAEDGVRYESVYQFASRRGWPVIRGRGKDEAVAQFINMAKPDFLWITDYRFLIPSSVIALAAKGAVNLHPSLLPRYRGRAPINWAILNGERELGLTAHFVDEGMDTGPIIAQYRFALSEDQDAGDALEILYPLYQRITREVLGHLHSASVPSRLQDHRLASVFPARKPGDGLIDWKQPAKKIRDLIRAVAHPYPGAFTFWGTRKVILWKACLEREDAKAPPGQVLSVGLDSQFCVACSEGAIRVLKHTQMGADGKVWAPQSGDLLG